MPYSVRLLTTPPEDVAAPTLDVVQAGVDVTGLLGGRESAPPTALVEIAAAAVRLDEARADLQATVDRAREQKTTWADIGAALGISKQTAWEKFGGGK